MTITETLQRGAYIRSDKGGIADGIEKMFVLFTCLHQRKGRLAGTVSGAALHRLALGRALKNRPRCCCWMVTGFGRLVRANDY